MYSNIFYHFTQLNMIYFFRSLLFCFSFCMANTLKVDYCHVAFTKCGVETSRPYKTRGASPWGILRFTQDDRDKKTMAYYHRSLSLSVLRSNSFKASLFSLSQTMDVLLLSFSSAQTISFVSFSFATSQ